MLPIKKCIVMVHVPSDWMFITHDPTFEAGWGAQMQIRKNVSLYEGLSSFYFQRKMVSTTLKLPIGGKAIQIFIQADV